MSTFPNPTALQEWVKPPREFTLIPFWFWNDDLTEAELLRQIEDFDAHGVYGFVIHPRVGLPRSIGWMSERMLELMRFAVEEAAKREMYVVLYDEGMYPSGSACGQVVEENPLYRVRALDRRILGEAEEVQLKDGENLVAVVRNRLGERVLIYDRQAKSVIRGIHYIGEGPAEDEPPAADLLNPEAMQCFIRKSYDRFAATVGDHFGKTVVGIFTDEPGLLGRPKERGIQPGTTGILEHVNRILGYDFTPHLPALWDAEEPDAKHYKEAYHRAVNARLEETYYKLLHDWCEAHGTQLMGHPGEAGDIGLERYFHIPGQDLVWRWVLPNETSALEGKESVQGKCSSSAMLHLGRRRNSNECFGAYGHQLTFEEAQWLVNWCLVRGVNMFIPHAFYYSIRGPRKDERPPDVGPNSAWWDNYAEFAGASQRMSWLNTDSEHVCNIAILGENIHLPWDAAKVCFQSQRDFNYIEMSDLWERAEVTSNGIKIGGMFYELLIVDGISSFPDKAKPALEKLAASGHLIAYKTQLPFAGAALTASPTELVQAIDKVVRPDVQLDRATSGLRYRHARKNGLDFYILHNEEPTPFERKLQIAATGKRWWLDPVTGKWSEAAGDTLSLGRYEMKVLCVAAA